MKDLYPRYNWENRARHKEISVLWFYVYEDFILKTRGFLYFSIFMFEYIIPFLILMPQYVAHANVIAYHQNIITCFFFFLLIDFSK